MLLEIGKIYRSRGGRLFQITSGTPPIHGKREGWQGIYHGETIDNLGKHIRERWEFDGTHWNYFFNGGSFNVPELDLLEEVNAENYSLGIEL